MRFTDWIACLGLAVLASACTHQEPAVPDRITPATSADSQIVTKPVAPKRVGSMAEYRIHAARRIHESNPQLSFEGPLPDPLASIPVLLVHLNPDGSVRKMDVLRVPHYHPHTVELAKQAVLRAQPFGPVAHLPKPWQFSETFLFNDKLKFQLRTLVELPPQ